MTEHMRTGPAPTECVAEIIPWCPDCRERFDPDPHYRIAHESFSQTCEHCGAKMSLQTEIVYFVKTEKSIAADKLRAEQLRQDLGNL